MSVLRNGTVVPSWVNVVSAGRKGEDGSRVSNVALRVGEVKDIILSNSKDSISKRWTEYSVVVAERKSKAPAVISHYPNCTVANLFGGSADHLRYTLRPSTNGSKTEIGQLANGSKVLILCLDGMSSSAYIIGGVPDRTSSDKDDPDLGHHLDFEFNGLAANINSDGELEVTFAGATDAAGNPIDSSTKGGGLLNMLKDGTLNVEVPSNITLKSTGVLTGAATDATMMGSTYRQAQATLHSSMQATLASMTATLAAAAAGMATAGAALAAPLLGPMVAGPALLAAATQVASLGAEVAALSTAIATFEAGSATYLSLKNHSD